MNTFRDWFWVDLELGVQDPSSSVCAARATRLVEKESQEYFEAGKEISLKADPLDPFLVFSNSPWTKILE